MTTSSAIDPRLLRGVDRIFSEQELRAKLKKGKPLRVKLGVDPTAPDLHLGHTVTLNKLRQFQDLGHTVVFIVGDYTALIGDPSGRSETRPPMSREEVEKNSETYKSQVFKILKRNQTEVRNNAAWLGDLFSNIKADPLRTILGILSKSTVQQLMERDDFSRRLREGNPISLLELIYPLMQGYDSVEVESDVEIGGTDQLFNLLMGRQMQKNAGQEPQVVMTLPLLEGIDGVKKMSKSYGNHIALNDSPEGMFGKIMSIPDDLMWKYYELLTEEDVKHVKARFPHPMEAKKYLGEILVTRYHNPAAAGAARAEFKKVFSKREVPDGLEEHRVSRSPIGLGDLLLESGLAPSKNEARRLLKQGAVEVAGERVTEDRPVRVETALIVKVGKRRFRKILPPSNHP